MNWGSCWVVKVSRWRRKNWKRCYQLQSIQSKENSTTMPMLPNWPQHELLEKTNRQDYTYNRVYYNLEGRGQLTLEWLEGFEELRVGRVCWSRQIGQIRSQLLFNQLYTEMLTCPISQPVLDQSIQLFQQITRALSVMKRWALWWCYKK